MNEVQRLLASLNSQGTTSTGQSLPSAAKAPDGDGPPPGPPPGGDSQPSSRFAANTLSSLLGVQQDPASSLAASLIKQTDTNGDGALSLSEIENAISGATSGATATSSTTTAASATDPLAAAFAKLDADGDGKISSSELTSALKAHHHHRHHQAPTAGSTPTAIPASTITTVAAPTGTTDLTATTTTG